MAIAQLNVSLESIRDKFGNQWCRRYGRKLVIGPMPDFSRRRRSKRQKETSRNFAKAHAYARKAVDDPVLRAEYARRKTRKYKTLRGFIMTEYLRSGELPRPSNEQAAALANASSTPGQRSGQPDFLGWAI
jgi:hypothetical protein